MCMVPCRFLHGILGGCGDLRPYQCLIFQGQHTCYRSMHSTSMAKTPTATSLSSAPTSATHTIIYDSQRQHTPFTPSYAPGSSQVADAGRHEALPRGLSKQLQRRGAASAVAGASDSPAAATGADIQGISSLVKQLAFSDDEAGCYIPRPTEKAKRAQQESHRAVQSKKLQRARAQRPAFVVPNRTQDPNATFDDLAAAADKQRTKRRQPSAYIQGKPQAGSHRQVQQELLRDQAIAGQRLQQLLDQCNTFQERYSRHQPQPWHVPYPGGADITAITDTGVHSAPAQQTANSQAALEPALLADDSRPSGYRDRQYDSSADLHGLRRSDTGQSARVVTEEQGAVSQQGLGHGRDLIHETATWRQPISLNWKESTRTFGLHKTGVASTAIRHVYQKAQTGAMLGLSHRERLQAGIMELSAEFYGPILLPSGR